MSIVEFEGPPSWSLDASETGESTKCPWVWDCEQSIRYFIILYKYDLYPYNVPYLRLPFSVLNWHFSVLKQVTSCYCHFAQTVHKSINQKHKYKNKT